jgi:hypothetical protein
VVATLALPSSVVQPPVAKSPLSKPSLNKVAPSAAPTPNTTAHKTTTPTIIRTFNLLSSCLISLPLKFRQVLFLTISTERNAHALFSEHSTRFHLSSIVRIHTSIPSKRTTKQQPGLPCLAQSNRNILEMGFLGFRTAYNQSQSLFFPTSAGKLETCPQAFTPLLKSNRNFDIFLNIVSEPPGKVKFFILSEQ